MKNYIITGFYAMIGLTTLCAAAYGMEMLDRWLACVVGMPWATWC